MNFSRRFLGQKIIQLFNNNWIMFFVFLSLGSFICVITRHEFFWDFANYHFYNAFAFVHNRLNYDIVPSSINTFLNPLIDLPLYFIIEYFNDNTTIAYALQGIWFGLLIFTFFKITTLFFSPQTLQGAGFCLLTTTIGITGQSVWFQAGTSTNEIPIIFLSSWAIYILLKMIKYPQSQSSIKFFFSGLILGSALGLKSTNIYVCIASGLSLILCFYHLKHPIKFIFYFTLGGLIGFLITNGWWMLKLWNLYKNPFFPFLNDIFKSPFFDDFNYNDNRFKPPFPLNLIFPYIWQNGKYKSAEIIFYDCRGIIYYTIALLFMGYLFLKPSRFKNFYQNYPLWSFFSTFLLLAYLLWLNIFSIYRYIGTIEILSAIFFVKLIITCLPEKKLLKFIYIAICINLIAILVQTPIHSYSWGNRLNQNQMVYMEQINLPKNTLLKLYTFPTAGVIPLLAKQHSFRALGHIHLNTTHQQGSDFVERNKFKKIRDEIIQSHTGPVVLISRSAYSIKNRKVFFNAMKKDLTGKYCRDLKNNLFSGLFICVPQELKDVILPPVSSREDRCTNCHFNFPPDN